MATHLWLYTLCIFCATGSEVSSLIVRYGDPPCSPRS